MQRLEPGCDTVVTVPPPADPPVGTTARSARRRAEHPVTPRRPDASMALINDLMARPADPEYAEAALRPHPPQTVPQRLTRSGLGLLVAFVLGIVLASAIVSLRAPQSSVQFSLTLLTDRIAERSERADLVAAQNESLSADVAQLQADALEADNPVLFAELNKAELQSGAVGVSGPGFVVEMSDAPLDAAGKIDPEERVQDIDVQVVVNGLWAAGAEAIAVNGQRLTALSAIRTAAVAIQVDLVPLSSPYTIEAIGDVREMQTAFARGSAADHLTLLESTYRIGVSTSTASELALPGAGGTTLRYARALDDVASSAQTTKERTP